MSDFREHAGNHLRTAVGTYIGPEAALDTKGGNRTSSALYTEDRLRTKRDFAAVAPMTGFGFLQTGIGETMLESGN